jgi:plasmid maintenance system antidote protein VapI
MSRVALQQDEEATPTMKTAADFRADRARHKIPIYELGPAVGMHPARLGLVLNGRLPLTPDLAQRLERAIDEASGEHRGNGS